MVCILCCIITIVLLLQIHFAFTGKQSKSSDIETESAVSTQQHPLSFFSRKKVSHDSLSTIEQSFEIEDQQTEDEVSSCH